MLLKDILTRVLVKLIQQGTAGFSPCAHLRGFHVGYLMFDQQPFFRLGQVPFSAGDQHMCIAGVLSFLGLAPNGKMPAPFS